ncbi:TonB-dependent receptor domain-containing protein [Phenylobacterium kunshanense]|uniref:TonB-dependent receptor n=1 Tax=Phenylobacterium kunshanense TaxID=1445034 RepID=A0A328BDW2_9CAUL|nr:TonB-dependent receptor [Phenylobacterium kunshanense]RAK63308.1 TonB-dependent receptor [Phenylobacterium kunshanense]
MNIKSMRERLLASSMICGAAFVALATPAAAQEGEVAEVVVTGTRIPSPNLESVSPVQVVGEQEVVLGGRPVTADILNQLPQVSQNSQTALSTTSNPLSGPGGVATVDLRGLGQQRTLVLVDGRRLGIGDPNTGNTNPSPDLNQIPSQLIQRVDVLTGGASATYGSDAIAGVVNFIMKRDFEGVQIDAQWGVFQHDQHNDFAQSLLAARGIAGPKDNVWDGESRDISIIMGANFEEGRGNVTGYFTYHDQEPVTQAKRDYSACQIVATAAGVASCAGSPNSNQWVLGAGGGFNLPGAPTQVAVVGNTFAPWSGTANTTPPPLFNSNDYAYLMQQGTRYTAGFLARYEVNKHLEFYGDFGFMNDRSNVLIAPTGLFQGAGVSASGGFLINCNNPFMSAQQRSVIGCSAADIASGASKDLLIGRRNIEGGGRNQLYEHTNYRAVFGGRGEITGSWKYDLYGSYYYTNLYTASQNYLSISRLQNALQVVQGPNGPVCISGGSCVPYNIFQDGQVTDAALAYLDIEGTSKGSIAERIIEGVITGDLGDYGVKSPWAQDGVGVAAGFHYRRDHLEYQPDSAQLSGDLSGAGGASTPIDNSLSVKEFFGEARVPLVQDMPWAKDITAEVGYRYSDYSTDQSAKTWKLGLSWAPTEDFKFRGSYNKAIRAASILELYTPQAVTNTSQVAEDPCAAGAQNPASLQACQNTGITAAQYGVIPQCPSGQCAVLNGGNPLLAPETAKTFTIGVTGRPSFIRGFTASVDYYHVDLKDVIGAIPLGVILQRCLDTGDQTFCSQIVRAQNGILFGNTQAQGGYINGTNVNVGAGVTSGIDLQASYVLPIEDWGLENWGSVSVNLSGSYLLKQTVTPLPGDDPYDCAGLFGPQCQTVSPRWRHTLRVNWNTPWDVTASLAWRYIHSSTYEQDTDEPTIGTGGRNAFNHKLPQRSYLDLSAVWNVNDMFAVRGGINNILDQDPPLVNNRISQTGSPNTYPTYDLLGRKIFVGVTASF